MSDMEIVVKRIEEIRGFKVPSSMSQIEFVLSCIEELQYSRSIIDALKQECMLEKQKLIKAQEHARRYLGNIVFNT